MADDYPARSASEIERGQTLSMSEFIKRSRQAAEGMFWKLYGDGDGPHAHEADLYDAEAVSELRRGACVRSGKCCLSAPCPVALYRGEQFGQRCSFLIGDEVGAYSCRLADEGDSMLIVTVGIGVGCNDPNNTSRMRAGQNQTKWRKERDASQS